MDRADRGLRCARRAEEDNSGGIDAAASGGEVVVADGSYSGVGNRKLSFLGKLIVLRSSSEDPQQCIIDCEGQANGFHFINGEPLGSIVSGFTIVNGAAEIGAGAFCDFNSDISFRACAFIDNIANGPGGAIYARGGCDVSMIRCTMRGNGALDAAGAFVFSGSFRVVNSLVTDNHAMFICGGLWPAFNQFEFTNTAIVNNVGTFDGIGLEIASEGSVNSCSIAGNYGGPYGPMQVLDTTIFHNCLIWGNLQPVVGGDSRITMTYSDVEGGWPGVGNINADPLFVQPGSDDLRLSFGSPCVDAGLTAALPGDEFDLDGDGDFAEPIPYDAAGNPRVQGAAVDIGAYEGEYRPLPSQASVLDLGPGETAFLVPTGGPFNPVESSVAVVTNGSTTTAEVTLTQSAIAVHPLAGTYSELGSTMAMQTTLAPGTMHNRMFITFTAGELRGRDPLSLDLTSFNPATGNWRLAVEGNSAPSPGYEGPVGDRIVVEGTGLDWGITTDQGDYGVFWNPLLQKSFVWANLDYAADFALGTALCYADCAPPNGDGVVDNTDVQGLLAAWGHRAGGIFDISLDGIVNGVDLALLLGAWGGCEGGIAPITATQKTIAPNWGRVVTAAQREVDLDGNSEIDGRDMSLILAAWSGDQPVPAESNAADLNGDGRVNRDDIDALLGRR